MTELTLFGKAMELEERSFNTWWRIDIGIARVIVSGRNEEAWRWWMESDVLRQSEVLELPSFASNELARDDAERALRELYEALKDVVEPWRYTDPPLEHDGILVCGVWPAGSCRVRQLDPGDKMTCFANSWWLNHTNVCWAPYAWRPMPKAAGRTDGK